MSLQRAAGYATHGLCPGPGLQPLSNCSQLGYSSVHRYDNSFLPKRRGHSHNLRNSFPVAPQQPLPFPGRQRGYPRCHRRGRFEHRYSVDFTLNVAVRKRAAEGTRYEFGYVDTDRTQTEQNTRSLDPHPISNKTMPYGRLHVIGEPWLHVMLPPSASCGLAAGFLSEQEKHVCPWPAGLDLLQEPGHCYTAALAPILADTLTRPARGPPQFKKPRVSPASS
jgi:hypothetical protein